MKSINRNLLFFKIWGVHFLAYYIPFGFLFKGIDEIRRGIHPNFIELIIFSPFIGLSGLDGFLLYIFMAAMGIALLFTNNFFKAYYLPMCILLLGVVTYIIIDDFQSLIRGDKDVWASFLEGFLEVPLAMVIAIAVNWLVFRKTYRRLKEENLQNTTKKSTDEYHGNDEGK